MNNRKLKQLVKEALSNMIDEDDTDILGDEKLDTALSANEETTSPNKENPATDIADGPNLGNDHFQNVEEMDMGGDVEDPDADDLADQIIMMSDAGLEEETLSLHEFFDLDEMARKAQAYKLTDRLTNAGSFLQRVNDKIKSKTMGAGGRGRKAKEFTDGDITNMLDVLGQGTFTSQDVVSAIGRFDKVQPVNAILAKMREKGYIDYSEELKKSMEPDTSSEPKRRGRPTAPKSPSPEDEFDAPEMEPEMTSDDDPIVQQAMRAQAQAQEQDPKKQAVKSFMDQMKAMGVISDDNKVLDMDTYKDEFAKFKSTMNETLNESKNKNKTMKKLLLTERFQQLAGIKPLYTINSLNERGGATFNPELIQERDRDNAGMFGGWGDESLGLGKPVTEPSNLGLRSKADAGKTSLSYDVMMKSKDGSKNVQIFATVGDEPKLSYRANGIEDDVVEKWLEARKDDIQRYFSNMNYSKEELGKNFHIGGGYEDKVTDEDMKSIKDGISKLASVKIGKI